MGKLLRLPDQPRKPRKFSPSNDLPCTVLQSDESGNKSDKPMKQTSLFIRPSMKRCSLAHSEEITTEIVDYVLLDLRPIAVVDGCGFNKLLTRMHSSFKNVCYEFFETAIQHYDTETTRISIHKKLGNYHRYMDK